MAHHHNMSLNYFMQWGEIGVLMVYRSVHTLTTEQYMVFMIFFELWLILHYASKLKHYKLQQRTELANLRAEIYSSAQISILEQAMLYDRELRKLQQEFGFFKAELASIKQQLLVPLPSQPIVEDHHQELMDVFIDAQQRGLRRICVSGRGWINSKKIQQELGISDSEVKSLCR